MVTHDPAPGGHDGDDRVSFEEFGLSAFTFRQSRFPDDVRSGRTPVMPTHSHLEVELTLIESGGIVLEFSGTGERLRPSEAVVYWGGVPHRVLEVAPRSVFHVVQVPLVDVLSWTNSAPMLRLLLEGSFLREPPNHDDDVDRVLFARWSRDLRSTDWQLRRAAALEIEARYRRFLAHVAGVTDSAVPASDPVQAQRLLAVTRFVAAHFTEPITVDTVAAAAGWNRDHLMASFRRSCGITLWTYVTRLRLAEAQRLLTTTDLPVMQICHRAGFGSTSQMYDVFKRHRGMTPARYRQTTTPAGTSVHPRGS